MAAVTVPMPVAVAFVLGFVFFAATAVLGFVVAVAAALILAFLFMAAAPAAAVTVAVAVTGRGRLEVVGESAGNQTAHGLVCRAFVARVQVMPACARAETAPPPRPPQITVSTPFLTSRLTMAPWPWPPAGTSSEAAMPS